MIRETSQYLAPKIADNTTNNSHNVFPSFQTSESIFEGYKSLALQLTEAPVIIVEGYIGVDFEEIVIGLIAHLNILGKRVGSINVQDFYKSHEDITNLTAPFLGGDDPVFGRKTSLQIGDYFNAQIKKVVLDEDADITIIYGVGASLCNIKGCLVYADVPKNEIQYRMRSNSILNLGLKELKPHKQMYKHFYFVDWVVCNDLKKRLLPFIEVFIDQQRPKNPTWMNGKGLRASMAQMSTSVFRARPWFEPGVWGGDWMKKRFNQLNPNVPNYAWSFELIAPENGVMIQNNDLLLEVTFDLLMFAQQENILGKAAARFKDEFPIRFDFLDTYNGGNLSVQCHPTPAYIKKEFGENFTQDETYYILDAEKDTHVYLGFHEDINQTEFKKVLEDSFKTKKVINIERYVQKIPSKKHDLFLIPHGTVHCSGINNMVLEISATPYIFTFKMYDWQRMDLEGQPRPLNIERAFENIDFSRKGAVVEDTLISKQYIQECGEDWQKVHVPTHPDHFYDVLRYEFDTKITIPTNGQCHILMLVEGQQVAVEEKEGKSQVFNYAETFIVPAAAESYTLINKGTTRAKTIVSFVKESAC
ncbi:MAG: hypothetical protein COB60_00790 [Flavobacteriaceae bacterium]|nr:MAG: hypothetical protein COB60_00790 [Flavobacteriaceae bacterium]